MATKTTNHSFLEGDQSPEKLRREFIDKPLNAAKQSLLGTGLDLLNLMRVLPDAFIASQQRELERLKASGKDDDERMRQHEVSIEQAVALRTTVAQARRAFSGQWTRWVIRNSHFMALCQMQI